MLCRSSYIDKDTFDEIFDFQGKINKEYQERKANPSTLSIQVSIEQINWLCNVALEALSALSATLGSHAEECPDCKADLKYYGLDDENV